MPYNILLVDDMESVRGILAQILHTEGHAVVPAANGIEALRAMQRERFDLIITDVAMPDMDGIELMRVLRRRDVRPKVIALSGTGRGLAASYLAMAADLGVDATLTKPVSVVELLEEIERVMGEPAGAPARHTQPPDDI